MRPTHLSTVSLEIKSIGLTLPLKRAWHKGPQIDGKLEFS